MQEELQQAADRTARGKARRLLSRFGLRRLMRRVRRNGERHDLRAQLEAIRSSRWFDAAWYLDAYPDVRDAGMDPAGHYRSEEHTSELQSLMRISYAVFCLKTKQKIH